MNIFSSNIFLAIGLQNWVIVYVGIAIVFLALACLYMIFNMIPKFIGSVTKVKTSVAARREERKTRKETKGQNDSGVQTEEVLSGEVNAAISMALHLYFNELHDEESNVITIKDAPASAWSSKSLSISSFNQR